MIQDYNGPAGVMMNSESYSSYPSEAETLLMEGVGVYILGCEEQFKITNKHDSMKKFAGKYITVFYLFIWG